MSFFSKKIVGIDFHDFSAQLVEIRSFNNRVFLESYSRVVIPPSVIVNGEIRKDDELKHILSSLLYGANPKPIETKEIAIVFPSAKIFTHIFSFPTNFDRYEIAKAIPFEAEKVIPFSIQDVYFDFSVINEENKAAAGEGKRVLFAAIPKEIADRYLRLLDSMDLMPFLFGVDVESLRYGLASQISTNKNSLIIDVGVLSVNYLVIRGGEIQQFVSTNRGGKYLFETLIQKFQVAEASLAEQKERERFDTPLLPDIEQFMMENFRLGQEIVGAHENGVKTGAIQNILLTGEFLNLPNFLKQAKECFSEKTVLVGDPKHSLSVEKTHFKPLILNKKESVPYSTYFTHAIGVALGGLLVKSGKGINLIPDNLRARFAHKRYTSVMIFSALFMTLAIIVLATFSFIYHANLNFQRKDLNIKKEAIFLLLYGERYQQIRREINSFNEEVFALNKIDNTLFSVPAVLENILTLLPPGIELTGIRLQDSDLMVEISGIAADRSSLLATHEALRNAPFIREVITPISNYDVPYNISFSIKVFLDFKNLPSYGGTDSDKRI